MSKIGRKKIDLGAVAVEIKGQELHYKGKITSGVHILPDALTAKIEDNKLTLVPKTKATNSKQKSDDNRVWGLNRALLANKIKGAQSLFEKELQINGLGFKAALAGQKITLTLGYSHKIDFELPKGVTLDIDKTGQKLIFKSADKFLVGHVCSEIRALRPPEPYKGTGIKLATEVIARKAGKTKAA